MNSTPVYLWQLCHVLSNFANFGSNIPKEIRNGALWVHEAVLVIKAENTSVMGCLKWQCGHCYQHYHCPYHHHQQHSPNTQCWVPLFHTVFRAIHHIHNQCMLILTDLQI